MKLNRYGFPPIVFWLLLVMLVASITILVQTRAETSASQKYPCRYEQRFQVKRDGNWSKNLSKKRVHRVIHRRLKAAKPFAVRPKLVEKKYDTAAKVYDLIECIAPHYGVGKDKAHSVAECESGHDPKAYNASGCNGEGCGGVFQHHMGYWDERAANYGHAGASVFDGYANTHVAMQYVVADGGWGAWECQ